MWAKFLAFVKGIFSKKSAALPPAVSNPEAPAPLQPEPQATGYRAVVLDRWGKAKILGSKEVLFEIEAKRALQYKDEFYVPVEKAIGIPWYVVAALDMREESFDHSGYLGNGDPWNKPSVHVPRGRGSFNSWHEGAVDALTLEGFNHVTSWDIVSALIAAERFNGLGYKKLGVPSPYIWAGTNIQVPGKYTSDGKFNPSVTDQQPGVAGLLLALKKHHAVDLREA
jgi:lysozyme family protein